MAEQTLTLHVGLSTDLMMAKVPPIIKEEYIFFGDEQWLKAEIPKAMRWFHVPLDHEPAARVWLAAMQLSLVSEWASMKKPEMTPVCKPIMERAQQDMISLERGEVTFSES